MSDTVLIVPDGLEGLEEYHETAPGVDGYSSVNLINRQWHTIWKPTVQNTRFRFKFAEAAQFKSLVLGNNTVWTAQMWSGTGKGIKLVTTTGDDYAGSGTVEYHVGGSTFYHPCVETDEPLWHETFDGPSVPRHWWHFYIFPGTAQMGNLQVGPLLLSRNFEVPIFERPQEVPVIYGVEGDYTTGGYSERSLLHGKKYGWDLKWVGMNDAELAIFDSFWETIEGGARPFVYRNEDSLPFYVYATMRGKMQRGEVVDQGWTIPLRLTIAAEGSVV